MSFEEKLKSVLGKYKVIGDTTYGLGYEEADELTKSILQLFNDEVVKVIKELERKRKNPFKHLKHHWHYYLSECKACVAQEERAEYVRGLNEALGQLREKLMGKEGYGSKKEKTSK